jgi:hypothetical protein
LNKNSRESKRKI